MWIILLFECFSVILQGNSQDVMASESQTVTQTSPINQAINWSTTGPAIDPNIQEKLPNAVHGTNNEILENPLIYSNPWRPVVMPMYYNPYRDPNGHPVESEDVPDSELQPTFIKNPYTDHNGTMSLTRIPSSNAEMRYPVFSDSVSHYPYPSKSVQNQFVLPPTAERPPIFYPNTVSINLRRSYSTNIRELQNSSDSIPSVSVTEPVTSSYEERFMQVLPNLPYPNMPIMPNRFMPYGNFRNQPSYYPPPGPFYFQPYPFHPPTVDDSHSVDVSNVNVPQFDRESGSVIIENDPAYQRLPELGSQVPVTDLHGSAENVPQGPSSYVPPSPMLFPIGRYPFVLPPPGPSTFLSNPVASRVLPLPSPEAMPIPIENPSTEVMSELDDRLPLDSNPEALPPVDSLLDSSVSENLQTDEKVLDGQNLKPSRIPYEFGYDMNDGKGTDQHRMEVSDASGVVTGSYGYRDMFGVYRLVNYIADKNGFRAFIKSNEPGVASSGSADVVVMADGPPLVAEGTQVSEPVGEIVPEPVDVIAEGSEKEIE